MKDFDFENKLGNGNTIYYKILDGTYYEVAMKLASGKIEEYTTNEGLMNVLKRAENKNYRLRFWYGYEDGRAWNEAFEVCGYVGRTNGTIKAPILIDNKRSWGGPGLSVGRIIRVDDIEEHRTLWKLKNFHVEPMEIVMFADNKDFPYAVMQNKDNGTRINIANFESSAKAVRYIDFMNGKRYSK